MGTIATVLIKNKRNGKTRRINENEWAHDLGKGRYNGWERVGQERHGDADEAAKVTIDDEAAKAQAAADTEVQADEDAEITRQIMNEEEAPLEDADEGTEAVDTETTDEESGDEQGLL